MGGKSGSRGKPVRAITSASYPSAFSASHSSAVRRHCHVMTGPTGSPVFLSQASMDSRWFEMPRAVTSASGALFRQLVTACCVACHIALASCCTQPGFGCSIGTGADALAMMLPFSSIKIAFEFVVPSSIARITWRAICYPFRRNNSLALSAIPSAAIPNSSSRKLADPVGAKTPGTPNRFIGTG